MSLTELVKAMKKRATRQREKENKLLERIAELSDYETAEAAKDIYAAEKHAYSFDGYLYQLTKLRDVLTEGVPADIALIAVDSCLDADAIIEKYRRL